MPYDDDYRELIVDVRDAIRKLLDESTHDSWINLRTIYGDISRKLEREEQERKQAEQKREQAEQTERKEREQREWAEPSAWSQLSRERRETLVLQALGDKRQTLRELAAGMNRELGLDRRPKMILPSEPASLVKRMWRDGQLLREPETFNKTHMRYRYSRNRTLEGPIADLESTLKREEA
jgi:hypothetical protein